MFNNKVIRAIFLCTVCILLWSYFSGLMIDVTRDAGKYATVAKEIFDNGNFINLTIHGDAYDQKPPLLFWLGAFGFSIGKLSNFWFKFPVLLIVFFGFFSAYHLGKSLYSKKVGQITALMMAFSLIYTLYSMDVHTDTPLQAFITFALWQLFEFIKTKRNIHWILGFLGIGLAMLSKGPIGAAIPAFAVIGHLLLKNDFKSFIDYRWYLGILLSFIVVSPALIGLMNQFGWDGIVFFFWDNNVGRVSGTYVKSINDPLFCIHTLIYLYLPWSLLFFISAFQEFRLLLKNKFISNEYFTLTGIWIFFIVLSISKSQLPNYIFGIVPLIAVLTAKWTDIALNKKQKLLKTFVSVQTMVTAILWAGVLFISFYLFPTPKWYTLAIIGAGFITTIYLWRKNDAEIKIILNPAIVFACLALLLNTNVFPFMFSFQAPPKAARYFTVNAINGEKLYNYHYPQYELFFYSQPQAEQLHSFDELENVAGKEGNWIFTDQEGFEQIEKLNLTNDTIIKYQHLYLNKGGRFINPKTRAEVLKPMYLIKY